MNFNQVFAMLDTRWGVVDSFLPFLLVFVIIFAILEKTHVLGTGDTPKKINLILALTIGLLVVIPHVTHSYPPGKDIVKIINGAIPTMSAVFIALVLAMILIGLAMKSDDPKVGGAWVPYVALAIVLYVFGAYAGFWKQIFPLSQSTVSIIVMALVTGLVVFLIMRSGGKDETTKPTTSTTGGSGGTPPTHP